MRSDTAPIIRLSEYRVPDFLIERVELDFRLEPAATLVTCRLALRPNPAGRAGVALELDGDELGFVAATLDGAALAATDFLATPQAFTLHRPPQRPFALQIVTRINPAGNTRLMGLYRSNGVYCTQCEADAFRRIAYFLDRPDVMSVWRVRIEAEKAEAPLLLSNGNPIEQGDIPGTTRHYAVWDDPHRKPCYLFALVAGDLDAYRGSHTTPSGRKVALNVYVEQGKAERAAYAMDALLRSMKWDEEKFGREYDLDLFNIVAVSDFNMGAMENKGLNVFNDRYILASPETATDQDYHNIEAVVAHEYFHNWTGNRITCRDWFQLCLKEGLTVFRDQEFSSDMRSRAVERIANVQTLRATQFVEDSGPLAHPVRPQQYKEINNFYTATVYNKGSELIRMLRLIVGPEAFRAGMDLYFARHDGEAAVMEQFIQCFADVSGRNLKPFMRWYDQAGTPLVTVREDYDARAKRYALHFAQETAATPGQPEKGPQIIPIRLGLIGRSGGEIAADEVFLLEGASASRVFEGVAERPIPSLLRGFSAPVRLEIERGDGDLLALARHDTDPFNRWQALQDAALAQLKAGVSAIREARPPLWDARLGAAIGHLIETAGADPAFAALATGLPTESDLAREIRQDVDPEAIGGALDSLRQEVGAAVATAARSQLEHLAKPTPFSPDGASAGRRALKGQLLRYLVAAEPEAGEEIAFAHFSKADNMSDTVNALHALLPCAGGRREEALARFHHRFREDHLVIDMWFALQARIPGADAVARVRELMRHPAFTLNNPNRARALIGTFAAGNTRAFHAQDGSGYTLFAEVVAAMDARNPQVAARLATAFRIWRNLEPGRRARAEAALRGLAAAADRSRDLADILERTLA